MEWGRHTRVLEVGTMAKGISGATVARKATDKYSTVMPTLNTAARTISRERSVAAPATSETAWLATMA